MHDGDEAKPRTKIVEGSRAPFNHVFFQTIFAERVRAVCEGHLEDVPVVLLQLADDREFDLCHIELLAPLWMAAAVFRNGTSCENMDTVFIPYDTITRVTLSRRDADERHAGFQVDRPMGIAGRKREGCGPGTQVPPPGPTQGEREALTANCGAVLGPTAGMKGEPKMGRGAS